MAAFLLITLLSFSHIVHSEISCRRPDGKQGVCKTSENCPEIDEIYKKPNKIIKDYKFLSNLICPKTQRSSKRLYCCEVAECYTPDGVPGTYVEYTQCPELKDIYEMGDTNFIFNSMSLRGDNKVCCGRRARPPIQKGNCAKRNSSFPPDPKTACCGIEASSQDRILGGSTVELDALPWLAILNYKRQTRRCGGSLISNRYVVTAAHCVTSNNPPISVTLGEYNISSAEDCILSKYDGLKRECSDPPLTVKIEEKLNYYQYNPTDPELKHDISLIRLAKAVPYTDFIRPICLTQWPDITAILERGTKLTTAGWGVSEYQTQTLSDVKLQVDLPFVNIEDCAQILNRNLWSNQLCAGGEKNKDSCYGDSGGPLMYKSMRGNYHELVGIVSYGDTKCGIAKPAVYTKVSEYIPWIIRNIKP